MPLPLTRPVKPRADVSDDENDYDDMSADDSSPSVIETGEGDDDGIRSSSESDAEDNVKNQLSNISFATLSKAQDSLSKKRKRGSDDATAQQDKLEALRARLRELRDAKGGDKAPKNKSDKSTTAPAPAPAAKKSRSTRDGDSNSESGSNSESDESGDEGPTKSRSSKHAPASQSSKRQVTRKRQAVEVPKTHVRDPRFGPLGGPPTDEARLSRNYSFLKDYQESEMSEIKAAIKKTKNEDEKDMLKRTLLSMESKKKAQENKERRQEVIREHRKKEKEAIKQGKNPYFLKKSDQKQLALVDKFNSMKSKDREKLMERRRKKIAGKEKKNMPAPRRM